MLQCDSCVRAVIWLLPLLADLLEAAQIYEGTSYRYDRRYLQYIRRPSYHRKTNYVREGNAGNIYISTGQDSTVSEGEVVGAVIGGVAFIIILICLIIFCWRRKNSKALAKTGLTTGRHQPVAETSVPGFEPYKPHNYPSGAYFSSDSAASTGQERKA